MSKLKSLLLITLLIIILLVIEHNNMSQYLLSTSMENIANVTIINNSSSDDLNCLWNEENIKFIDCNNSLRLKHKIPPYLISFEGSGNTYTRLIIELITQFYTGSVHSIDLDLLNAGFKGDGHCDDSVIILKAHAWIFIRRLWNLFINGTTNECRKLRNIQFIKRCNHHQTNNNHDIDAIFIFRNPWNAFFSEYQRSYAGNKEISQGHVGRILFKDFNIETFVEKLYEYTRKYIEIFMVYQRFKDLNRNLLIIHYENINNEIWDILQFLFTKKYLKENKKLYENRVNCIKYKSLPREEYIKRKDVKLLNNSQLYLTREYAYSQINKSVICDIWNQLKPCIYQLDLFKFGYHQFVTGICHRRFE